MKLKEQDLTYAVMKKINAILIEDEPLARRNYKKMITNTEIIHLLGDFENPIAALDLVKSGQVDLIFSDIMMPEMDGLSFIRSLPNRPFVIFLTAYPGFAAEGFNLDILDYLVKPVSPKRFDRAVEKAVKAISSGTEHNLEENIRLKDRNRVVFFKIWEVFYVEGWGDYVKIHTNEGVISSSYYTMKDMEQLLPGKFFFRIQRSFIVNVQHLASVDATKVILRDKDKTILPIGLHYRDAFYKKMGIKEK